MRDGAWNFTGQKRKNTTTLEYYEMPLRTEAERREPGSSTAQVAWKAWRSMNEWIHKAREATNKFQLERPMWPRTHEISEELYERAQALEVRIQVTGRRKNSENRIANRIRRKANFNYHWKRPLDLRVVLREDVSRKTQMPAVWCRVLAICLVIQLFPSRNGRKL